MSRRKPPEERRRTNTPDAGELPAEVPDLVGLDGGGRPAPAPPTGLLKITREWWEGYWSSPVSGLADRRSDLPAVRRLARLLDERERAFRAYRAQRHTTGSTGQLVVNPFAKEVASLDGRITALEDRLGLTPKARLDLGVTFGEAADRLEELGRRFEAAMADDGDGPDESDPRLQAIDAESSEAG